jgi:predicted 3-demethylubiquinone-9 3-methyltransferase (glyoxalase superfamily)
MITTCLLFKDQAEEAMNFYVSVFRNSKVLDVVRQGEVGPLPKGAVLICSFELDGHPFSALNCGGDVPATDAVSFVVDCEDQAEVDYYWDKLTADGGRPVQCSWLKDRFGLAWQVVPRILPRLLKDPDPAKAARVMQAMMQMVKIDVAKIEQAAAG